MSTLDTTTIEKREVRHHHGLLSDCECSDFAVRQRGNAPGKRNGRIAASLGCIARKPQRPVYRRP